MTSFEDWISRIQDKHEAISIYRAVLHAERFSDEDTFVDADSCYLQTILNNGSDEEFAQVQYWLKASPKKQRTMRKA